MSSAFRRRFTIITCTIIMATIVLPTTTDAFVPTTTVNPAVATTPSAPALDTTHTGLTLTWERDAECHIREMLTERRATCVEEDVKTSPLMISICGIPGSGKSTCAEILGNFLQDSGCLVFPHDGYHYPIADLKKFPDADAAIYRRGAPDTFDAHKLLRDLHRIRFGHNEQVSLPGFDHAVGDPQENQHQFLRHKHQVVICEGLYLLHDHDGWEDVADYFDLNIFVDANVDKCMERVRIRNRCLPNYTPDEIDVRVNAVDRKNAMTVVQSKKRAHHVFRSAAF